MLLLEERKALIHAALGHTPLDLLIQNVQVLDVYNGGVFPGAIGIFNGRIVSTSAEGYRARAVFDGQGMFAIPGLIDTHVHLDSTLVNPENLSELIVPCGTTTVMADPKEIANVAGMMGMKALLQSQDRLPYHIFLEVSSRVPGSPGLETTGGVLGLQEVTDILHWEEAVSVGELDPDKILNMMDIYMLKIEAGHKLGKIANGHAAGLHGRDLTAYACGGLADDHECISYAEAVERLKQGMAVLIREGSTERNLANVMSGFIESGYYPPYLMFCTDDKHADDIRAEGHINFMVNKAIQLGVPPIIAIQIATINAARHFRVDQWVGSLTPGRSADILLVEKLENIRPMEVFSRGQHVASHGILRVEIPEPAYPRWLCNTVKVTRGKAAQDFILPGEGESVLVRVIDLVPDQIINTCGVARLPVENGQVMAEPLQDVLKLAVVERYGKNGNIGIGFVRGFGIKRGALASSVSHDNHNIVVVGTNDADMAFAVSAVEETQGGLVIVADGQLIERLPLPVGGLLSFKPVEEVISILKDLVSKYQKLGGKLTSPFMILSFTTLPTVPELGLTDMGLIDVETHQLIHPILEPN